MQEELASHMLTCAEAYAAANGYALTTLGRKVTEDTNFFVRLKQRDGTFTVEKYDAVMGWFAENWPDKRRWPKGVPRPRAEASA
jgi:hypothetical protein